MIRRIKLSIIGLLALAMPMAVPVVASAATVNTGNAACAGAQLDATALNGDSDVACTVTDAESATGINDLVKTVINIFTWVVGVVSVIMIIVAGFRYVVSGGDSGGVSGAKNTIIYAIVGLVVVIMAQVIVRFVLKNING